jgi:DNA adenine methylase
VTTSTSQPEMKIGALAPWFGAKRTLAPAICEELGPHRAYWEPFCGSMAVLLAKPVSSMETVNDLHGDLINLARVVADPLEGPRLYRRLRRLIVSPVVQEAATDALGNGDPGERAFNYFAHAWLSRNGVAGTFKNNANFCRRYTSRGGSPAKRFASCVESIPQWRRRLRNVQILNDDGIDMVGKIEDDDGSVVYADPPYLKKGAKYAHDFDWLAHRRLAAALARFQRTRCIVSYYEHPDLAAMYPGWTKVEIHTTKAMVSQGQRDERGGAAVAPEILLINGPSYAKEGA